MFLSSKTYASSAGRDSRAVRAVAAGIDFAIDFATLGEYRFVSGSADDVPLSSSDDSAPGNNVWATGIEWSSAPERTRAACSLPRARNRDWARSRISG